MYACEWIATAVTPSSFPLLNLKFFKYAQKTKEKFPISDGPVYCLGFSPSEIDYSNCLKRSQTIKRKFLYYHRYKYIGSSYST